MNNKMKCYTIAACFPFEPPEKCMTYKNIFPGLSRISDFPGLSRSWNFQKKIQVFPGDMGTVQ